jgi:hypothetical protein
MYIFFQQVKEGLLKVIRNLLQSRLQELHAKKSFGADVGKYTVYFADF